MTLFGFSNQKGGMGSSLGWAKGLKKVQGLNPGKGEKGILIMDLG